MWAIGITILRLLRADSMPNIFKSPDGDQHIRGHGDLRLIFGVPDVRKCCRNKAVREAKDDLRPEEAQKFRQERKDLFTKNNWAWEHAKGSIAIEPVRNIQKKNINIPLI